MKNKTKGRLMIFALMGAIAVAFYALTELKTVALIVALWCIAYLLWLYVVRACELLSSDD